MNRLFSIPSYILFAFLFIITFSIINCGGGSGGGETSTSNNNPTVVTGGETVSGEISAADGGSLALSDGTKISIPPKALTSDTEISMGVISASDSTYFNKTVRLSPSGLTFNEPVTLETPKPSDVNETFIEGYVYSEDIGEFHDEYEILKQEPLVIDVVNNKIQTQVNHFSDYTFFGAEPLYVIFQLPSNYLMPGDIEYNLNKYNMWATGHTRMFLGFDDTVSANTFLTEGKKTALQSIITNTSMSEYSVENSAVYPKNQFIHSTDWNSPEGINRNGVYIESEVSFRDKRAIDENMYMGAKRRMDLAWGERLAIASYAVGLEGSPYAAWVSLSGGVDPGIELLRTGYTCTGLIEASYENIGKGLTFADDVEISPLNPAFGNPIPVQQFGSKHLEDINEIFVFEGEHIKIPVYGALRSSTNIDYLGFLPPGFDVDNYVPKSYKTIQVTAFATTDNMALGLGFINGAINWQADSKLNGKPWEITFTARGMYNGEEYTKSRKLTIHVIGDKPQIPKSVNAESGDLFVDLSWIPVTGATSYNVYWSTSSEVGLGDNKIIIDSDNASNETIEYTHTELNNGQKYYYVITAENSFGESDPSEPVSTEPSAPDSTPAIPRLTANGGDRQVTLIWNTISKADSYNIYWSTSSGVGLGDNKIEISTESTSSYIHSNLVNGTTYYYRITAENTAGPSALSAEVFATPQEIISAPDASTGVSASAGEGTVTISWNSVTGANSYNIYWSQTPGTASSGTKISNVTSTSYIHRNLTAGTTYYYVVTAQNAGGESIPSSPEVNATPISDNSDLCPRLSITFEPNPVRDPEFTEDDGFWNWYMTMNIYNPGPGSSTFVGLGHDWEDCYTDVDSCSFGTNDFTSNFTDCPGVPSEGVIAPGENYCSGWWIASQDVATTARVRVWHETPSGRICPPATSEVLNLLRSDSVIGGTPGESCGTVDIYDCAGTCVDESIVSRWIGDGQCDDGSSGIDLQCSAFNNDGGDCD